MLVWTMMLLACGTTDAEEVSTPPTESAIDCATEPPRPRCPAQQGGRCAELWAVVNAWEAACQPAEPVDCSQEVFPPKCPPGTSETCDEGWAATNAWRAACRPDAL